MSEWKKCTLGDVLNLRRGYDLPHSKMMEGNIPVAGSNGIIGTHNIATPIEPCITVGRSGSAGSTFIYDRAWAHNTTLYIDDFKGNDPRYLYYLLLSLPLKKMAGGSAVPSLNRNHIHPLNIAFPTTLETQHKIASILSSLDDKIAVNKKICENLEAQAQALFKHWFIDFAPFKDGQFVDSELGMIPEGWRVCAIGEICRCELGGTPSRANKTYWGGNIAWINSGEVNKFRICEASEFITEEGLNHSATKLLPAKTTVLAITGATLGQVSLLEIDSCANQSVVGIKENDKIPYTFIFPAIKSKIKELVNMQTGGAQQHINKDNIQSLNLVIPPQFIMDEYKSTTFPLYDEIGKLCFENLRLVQLRDTLLPKLMSGQIRI